MRFRLRLRLMRRRDEGFTLVEVLVAIVLLGIMGAIAFQSLDLVRDHERSAETSAEMDRILSAIAGNADLLANGARTDFGYVGDVGSLPPDLAALAVNPGGYATWKGPYIRDPLAERPDDFLSDAWGNAYAYAGVTLTSAGSGGNPLVKRCAGSAAELTSNTVEGAVSDGGGNPPGTSSAGVAIRISYPDGSGGNAVASTNPDAGGAYRFSSMIPQGIRTVTAVVAATGDTLVRPAVVLPGSVCSLNLRFRGNLWGASTGRLAYVAGTADTLDGGRTITFSVRNDGAAGVTITSLKATYGHDPAAYYPNIVWAGATVAARPDPRFASDEPVSFASSRELAAGATAVIELQEFQECATGACNFAGMAGTTFTISFSDGSVVSFTV